MNAKEIPKDGLAGLRQNWKHDMLSGFAVSLIALPLCLGIAGASGFPPIMGVMTAIVGGLLVSWFSGSQLTIKGPAAGLIVIVAGCVDEFGGGDIGWKLALGVVVVVGVLQVLFGFLKVARFADIFPVSAVHGLLAAIGIIIISRQIHLLLGVDPSTIKGMEPLHLIMQIPTSIMHETTCILEVGLVSLALLFGLPMIKNKWVKKIPSAMVVLVVSIVLGQMLHLDAAEYAIDKPMLNPGELSFAFNADFSGIISHTSVFLRYVFMFLLIGTLESLLSNKAIDLLDPWKRKSNGSKDLVAVGAGNMVSGFLGGLPMISEIARSSANVNNGGRTKWANFFHGGFVLIYVVALLPIIKMVPVAALSAMLIYVGLRLASAKEFRNSWSLGKDQFIIFIITMVMCLLTDLLIGVFSGVIAEMIIHFVRGLSPKDAFKATFDLDEYEDVVNVSVGSSLVFTNVIALKRYMNDLPKGKPVYLDLSKAKIVDHTSLETLHRIEHDFKARGIEFHLKGLHDHKRASNHHLAAAYRKKSKRN